MAIHARLYRLNYVMYMCVHMWYAGRSTLRRYNDVDLNYVSLEYKYNCNCKIDIKIRYILHVLRRLHVTYKFIKP